MVELDNFLFFSKLDAHLNTQPTLVWSHGKAVTKDCKVVKCKRNQLVDHLKVNEVNWAQFSRISRY